MSWEGIGGRMVEVDEYLEDDGYVTVVLVMLENFLVQDDRVWTEGWFNSYFWSKGCRRLSMAVRLMRL